MTVIFFCEVQEAYLSTAACLIPMACTHFTLPALFSEAFPLGFSEVFPAATLWFQSFIYSRQHQACREMALSCQPVYRGSNQPHRFALRALALVLSTILGIGSLTVHVVPASGFLGLSNTKLPESEYLL